MGENAHVDLGRLRHIADRVSETASEIADLRWPELDPDVLRGSAVSAVVASRPVAGRLDDVVTGLREWVTAAWMSADAFERADAANGDRFTPR